MKIEQLKSLIREVVDEHLQDSREQMIREIKAELFDMIMSRPAETAVNRSNPPEDRGALDRSSLKELMGLEPLGQEYENRTGRVVNGNDLPSTFQGGKVTSKHAELAENVINRDYGPLMKKMLDK